MSTIEAPVPASDSPSAVEATPSSLPAWLLHQAATRSRATALRTKELGRWREASWADYAERVAGIGRALMHMGVKSGDRVAILSDNRAEWLATDLAVQGIGAATVALYVTSPASEIGALLQQANVEVVIVEDEEQFDKVLEVSDQLSLRHVVVIDPRGIRRLDDPASSFESLEALGSLEAVQMRSGDVNAWRSSVAALDPSSVATVIFTPATTGNPKGAQLSHNALVTAATAGVEALGLRPDDEIVSSLPLCDIAEHSVTAAQAVCVGAVVNFGEGGEALVNDLREVRPTVMVGTPRLWERFLEGVDAAGRGADPVKRAALRSARRRGRGLSDLLVKRPLRANLGLMRTRVAITTTAPCSAAVVEFWRSVGVPLRQAYGLTEASGFVTVAGSATDPAGSVGRAVHGAEVRLGPDNEVLVRGPGVFAGYLGDSDASGAALDGEGWLHTGDVGSLDDGVLSIVGRIKDIVITSSGHRAAPRAIEARLEESPYVRAAVLLGDQHPCLGALIVIDSASVGDWAADRGGAFTTFATLAALPEVRELIAQTVGEANAGLDERDRIGCFTLLPQELGDDEELVTATGKVRRPAVRERFKDLVTRMYAERGNAS